MSSITAITPTVNSGDLHGALVAHLELVGDLGRRAGDVGLDTRRRRRLVDDVAQRVDGLQRQRLALVAGEEHLDVGGLAVGALRAGRGQRIAPEVLDVLDVLGVRPRSA